jgi:hypothetical protein
VPVPRSVIAASRRSSVATMMRLKDIARLVDLSPRGG